MNDPRTAVDPTRRNPAPTELEQLLDPHWLAAALDDVGPDDQITDIEQVGRSETLASKVRVAVTIEDRDGRARTEHYCIKAHLTEGPETLLTETHAYRELCPKIDVRTPRAHYTGIDEARGRSLIIMDDVEAEGGRFLSAHEPYSVRTCEQTLAQLARLHAATWGDQQWEVDWLSPRMTMTAALFPSDALQNLLEDGRGAQIPSELLDSRRLIAAVATSAELSPTCVIHGDTHSGNVYVDREGLPCWIDWQVAQLGHWSTDISYHLATALEVEDRRAHERDLVAGYLAELARLGVSPPSWDEAWERYTLGFSWGFLLWSITRISSREVVLIHMPRLGAALADHDTWNRLDV
jgi:aminoglycoside phosphotransferase (APT) family kinase protein